MIKGMGYFITGGCLILALVVAAAWVGGPHDPGKPGHKWYESATCGEDKCEFANCRSDESPGAMFADMQNNFAHDESDLIDDGNGRVVVKFRTLETGFYSTLDACKAAINRINQQSADEKAAIDKYR